MIEMDRFLCARKLSLEMVVWKSRRRWLADQLLKMEVTKKEARFCGH